MPGPNLPGTILTSNDAGLGTNEFKVKNTYLDPGAVKYLSSRWLFVTQEEADAFFKNNPQYKGYLDLDDLGKLRGPDVPYKINKQLDKDIGEKVHGSAPKKAKIKAEESGKVGKAKPLRPKSV